MIRPTTLVCALLAAGSGLYLYQVKHQAQLLDRQIHHIRETTEATLSRAGVMRAEYALLNDPSRLEELAGQYLPELRPTLPAQWTSMSELDKRLPPVGAPTADPAPLEADPPPTASAEPATHVMPPPHPAPIIAAAPVAPPRTTTTVASHIVPHAITLAARPQPSPANAAAARPAVAQAEPLVPHGHAAPPVFVAQAQPARAVHTPAPSQLAAQGAPIYAASAHADGYAAAPVSTAAAVNRISQPQPSVPIVASALGMARTMTVSPDNTAPIYQASQTR